MTKSVVTDASEVFRHFADAYRGIRPTRPITADLDAQITDMIDDICAAKPMSALREGLQLARRRKSHIVSPVECSSEFLDFLSFLQHAADEQKTYRLSSARAAELLYNFDGPEQSIMELIESEGTLFLISTQEYEELHGRSLRLVLSFPVCATDWTFDPSKNFVPR